MYIIFSPLIIALASIILFLIFLWIVHRIQGKKFSRTTKISASIVVGFFVIALVVAHIYTEKKLANNEDFANKLIESILNNTDFYLSEISEDEDIKEIEEKRELLHGSLHLEHSDFSYGSHEYHYCLDNKTAISIFFSDRNNSPKFAQINIYEPGSFRAEMCKKYVN